MDLPEALSTIEELRRENAGLRKEAASLREVIASLHSRIEELLRTSARQAAPFRRREKLKKPTEEKKRPGRKGGHRGVCRKEPERIDERIAVTLDVCPSCGGEVSDRTWVRQCIEDLPSVRPHVTELWTCVGKCSRCGEVRSTHPRQVSTAGGAAGVHLGARALGLAAALKNQLGLTASGVCKVLKQLGGLSLTPGGLMKALQRCGKRVETEYEGLIGSLRTAPAVFADETSWWVDEPGWWLWVFADPETIFYRVDRSRSSAVVLDLLGVDFAGMLVSDCLNSYDPPPYRKHKCIAHHLRALSERVRQLADRDRTSVYLAAWKVHLKDVLETYRNRSSMTSAAFAAKYAQLRRGVEEMLARSPPEPEEIAFRNRLLNQRDHLLGCLEEPAAEPTNNRAERALRPAVIARKLSCGNRTETGRRTWEILASLAATCQQRGQDFADYLAPRLLLPMHAR